MALGNPGAKYDFTPHNIGFQALDVYLKDKKLQTKRKDRDAHVFSLKTDGQETFFIKPRTFMNRSGLALCRMAEELEIEDPLTVLVMHDEADLEEGRLKVKKGGGTGGHNGLESIVQEWQESGFYRLRIGVGRPEDRDIDLADYLLCPQPVDFIEPIAEAGSQALADILRLGPDLAMNSVNSAPALNGD